MPLGINVSGEIYLQKISGNVVGLFDRITCNCLTFDDIKLNSDEIRSLSKILQSRVKEIHATLDDFCLLDNYDGIKGHCDKIVLINYERIKEDERRVIMKKNLVPRGRF